MERSPRIVLFTNSLGAGGAERVVSTLANRWASAGSAITILTLDAGIADAYELHPAIERITLDLTRPSTGIVSALSSNWRRVAALRRHLRAIRPQTTIAFLTGCNVLLALARPIFNRGTFIGAERVHPPQFPLGRLWEGLRSVLYARLDAVVAQTSETREWLLANTSARVVPVIPNPVVWPLPEAQPAVAPESIGRAGRRRLLAIGRLTAQKGFDLLISAFAPLTADFPDWELVILGEGEERPSLLRQIATLGVQDSVYLAGTTGNIGTWLTHADAFVLSSRFEGFPNALAEAMACGVAVVSFDCDTGPRDLIRDGVDGLLVPAGSMSAMTQALARMMADDEFRESLAQAAVAVRQRFSLDRVDALWHTAIRDVAAGGRE